MDTAGPRFFYQSSVIPDLGQSESAFRYTAYAMHLYERDEPFPVRLPSLLCRPDLSAFANPAFE